MRKKFFYTISFIVLFWVLVVTILLFLQKSTRVWEKTIQKNVIRSLPPSSEFYLGKIKGNIFGNFFLDSLYLKIDTTIQISVKKIQLKYSLWSLIKGNPVLSAIHVDYPTIRIAMPEEEEHDSGKTDIPFDFKNKKIEFERLLPDTFHLTCQKLVQGLPAIVLNDIFVKKLKLVVNGESILSDVSFQMEYNRNRFRLKQLSGKILEKVHFTRGRFVADIAEDAILISQLVIQTRKSIVSGKIDIDFANNFKALLVVDECKFQEDITKLATSDTSNSVLQANGYVYLYPESLYFDISLNGKYNQLSIEKSTLSGILGKSSVFIRNFWMKGNMGKLYGQIYSQFGGRTYADIRLEKINLHYLIPGIDTSSINSRIFANVNSWNPASMSGDIFFNSAHSLINEMNFNRASLRIYANEGEFSVDSSSGLYLDDDNSILLSGNINHRLKGKLKLSFIDLDFKKVGEAFNIPDLKGFGSGSFEIFGDLNNPDGESYLLLDSLGIGDIIFYGIEEKIAIKQLFHNREGNYFLDISSGTLGNIFITDALMKLYIKNNTVFIDSLTFYNIENFIDMKGMVQAGPNRVTVSLPEFRISYQSIQLYNDEPIKIIISPQSSNLSFESFHLITNRGGEVDARGELSWESASSFALYLRQIDLNFVNQFNLFDFSARGFANVEITLENSLTNPLAEFEASFTNLRLDTLNMGFIDIDGQYENKYLNLQNFLWYTPKDTLKVEATYRLGTDSSLAEHDLPSNRLMMHIAKFDLNKFQSLFSLNFPLEGIVQGDLNFAEKDGEFSGKGDITLSGFRYADFRLDSLYVLTEYADSVFSIKTGELNFGQTKFYFTGSSSISPSGLTTMDPENIPFSLFLATKTSDMGFLGDLNEELQNIRGNVQLSAQLEGTINRLRISYGNISVKNSEIYLYKLANPIHVTDADININNNLLTINKFIGYSRESDTREGLLTRLFHWLKNLGKKSTEEGKFSIEGNIRLDESFQPELNLKVTANRMFINYFIEDVRLQASTKNLRIYGKDSIYVTGAVTINKGKYLFDADRYERSLLLSETEVETPPYLVLNLDVDIPGNFYFKQEGQLNRMSFELIGNMRILKEAGGLIEPYGTLEILSGDMTLYGKKLQVINGKVSFTNPKELPSIEITATYKSPPYYFEITESGRIDAPDLKIDLYDFETRTPITGYDIKDKLSILVTGMTFDDLTRQGDVAIKEQRMDLAAKSLLNFLEGRTEQLVGLDKVSLETTNRLNEGIGDISLALGKYLTSNLYFEFRSPFAKKLSWEPGSEVFFSYRLSRNWSIGTSLSKTEEGNNKVSFNFLWKIYF